MCWCRYWGLISIALLAGKILASDAQWDSAFSAVGSNPSGFYTTLTADDAGNVFYGIDQRVFHLRGSAPSRVIGSGFNGPQALAVFGADLFLGTQGGVTGLWRWDGTNWTVVGGGVIGSVRALTVRGNQLYLGGSFTVAGDTNIQNLAIWNGAAFSGLGAVSGAVNAILIDGDNLYIAGKFDRVGGISAANIAFWNGSVWQALGTGTNRIGLGDNGALVSGTLALGKHPSGRLFAGGLENPGSGCPLFEWTGERWIETPLRSRGDNLGVRNIARFGNDLYAGAGFFTVGNSAAAYHPLARFDGTSWALVEGVPIRYTILKMATTTNQMYVFGEGAIPLSRAAFRVLQYDGTSWSMLNQAKGVSAGTLNALGFHNGRLTVAGNFPATLGITDKDCVAAWNGKLWVPFGGVQGEPNCSEVFATLSVGNGLYVATAAGVKLWNGTNWSVLGTNSPFNARALERFGTNIYCGTEAGLWAWDGNTWTAIPINGAVRALLRDDDVLYVGGNFTMAQGVAVNNIALWDGLNWQPLAAGVNTTVHCIVKHGTNIYVGGEFTSAGGIAANRVAKWDGASWASVGEGFSRGILANGTVAEQQTAVRALAFSDHGWLYAAGNFTLAEGRPVNHISMWDGRAWQAMGLGVRNFARSLLWHENNLYVGGDFAFAGPYSSSKLAVWHEAPALGWSRLPSNEVELSWPSVFSNYVLESKSDLMAGEWIAVANEISTVDQKRVTTNASSGPQRFFRLRQE